MRNSKYRLLGCPILRHAEICGPKKKFTQNSYHNKTTQFLAQNLRFVSQFAAGLTIPSFSYFREESSISRYKFCMVASQGCHGGHWGIHQPQGPRGTHRDQLLAFSSSGLLKTHPPEFFSCSCSPQLGLLPTKVGQRWILEPL